MISCIQRHISCLSGKLCGWLLKDLHYQQLYSELHSLEVWAFFLQFAVVHIHRVELILFIGTQFVPWLWVVLSVPADIWIKQCQAHHIQCCSSTPCSNKYEERNQAGMLLGLPEDLAEHVCGTGLPTRREKIRTHTKPLLHMNIVFVVSNENQQLFKQICFRFFSPFLNNSNT